jgi:hypothetical protein
MTCKEIIARLMEYSSPPPEGKRDMWIRIDTDTHCPGKGQCQRPAGRDADLNIGTRQDMLMYSVKQIEVWESSGNPFFKYSIHDSQGLDLSL